MKIDCVYCLEPVNENELKCPHCGKVTMIHQHIYYPGYNSNNKYQIGTALGQGGLESPT